MANSGKLLKFFEILVDSTNKKLIRFPEIPLRNLSIKDVSDLNQVLEIANQYATSVENLKLEAVNFTNENMNFYEFISKMIKLQHLTLQNCLLSDIPMKTLKLPNLQSATLLNCSDFNIKAFEAFNTLQSFKLEDHRWFPDSPFDADLRNLLEKVPNIKHLSLEGAGSSRFFDLNSFDFKIKRLDAYLMTFDWTQPQEFPRLDFLKSQLESLKEVNLERLPYDYDGGEVLKFMIEKMNLRKFTCGGQNLIMDGKKAERIDEVSFMEFQINAGLELIRQFPGEI